MLTPKEEQVLYTQENDKYIELAKALERLEGNADFQKVIIEGYFNNKALDSVSLLARPDIKKRGERTDIMEDLIAISNLKYFFYMIKSLGSSALYEKLEGEINE